MEILKVGEYYLNTARITWYRVGRNKVTLDFANQLNRVTLKGAEAAALLKWLSEHSTQIPKVTW